MLRWAVLGRLLALRPLRARPGRSLLSCVGIAAGVALVLAIQLINAAVAASVRSSVVAVSGRASAEVTGPSDGAVPDDLLPRLPGEAVGIVRADGTLAAGGRRAVVTLVGVPGNYAALSPPGQAATLDGGFGPAGAGGVVLLESTARSLGVAPGGTVSLAVRQARADVPVTGLLRGGADAGGLALMALPEAQRLFGTPGRVDSAYVVGASIADVAAVAPPGLVVREPSVRANQADRVLRGIRQLLTLASTVALFAGVFVVYNTMSMATTERRRELALLQALGLRRREQERLLYAEAGLLGVGGALLGLAGGYALARLLVSRVTEGYSILIVLPPVRLSARPLTMALAFAAGVAAALVATVLPARRLRTLPPVEGMRAGTPTEDPGERAASGRSAAAFAVPALLAGLAAMAVFLTVGRQAVGWAVLGLVGLMGALAAVVPVLVPAVVRRAAGPLLGRSPLVGRLAETSLLRTPRRTSYTVGALLVTLMLVIGLGGALGSFRASLDRLLGLVARGDVYLVAGEELTATLPSDLPVAELPSVRAAWRYRVTSVLWDDTQVALQAWDMEPFRREASLILESGDLDAAFDRTIAGDGTIVSTTLARDRDLSVGDTVEIPTPRGPVPLTVAGVSNDFLPQGTFYLDWDTAERLYGDQGVSSYAVVARGDVEAAGRDLAALASARGLDAELHSREERGRVVLAGIDRTFALADGVQLAGLAVALIAVVNTLLMTVVERQREIGMLRALGLLRRQVRRLVMTEALVLGAVGGGLASIAGYALSVFVTKAMEVGNGWDQVAYVPWRAMLLAPFAAAAVAAVGGWWPAGRAARIPIVEALRSE